jgi:GTP-binding protein
MFFMELINAKYLISSPNVDKIPFMKAPEIAFIGRSNVGKSSLINMLTNKKALAKISKSPGKTVMINHFEAQLKGENFERKPIYLVDLPGYGYAKRSIKQRKSWIGITLNYLTKRENLWFVCVLIDSRLKPQAIDLEFLQDLGDHNVPCNIIFTKTDKITQKEVSHNIKLFTDAFLTIFKKIPPYFITSAEKGRGRKEILSYWHSAYPQDVS